MAGKKISELTAADALTGTEAFPVVQAGATKKATVADVLGSVAGDTYTPAIDSTGDPVDLGTSPTQSGHYVQIGEFVWYWARIVFGTSADNGSGFYQINLPAPPAQGPHMTGSGMVLDSTSSPVAYSPTFVLPCLDAQLATSASGDPDKVFLFFDGDGGTAGLGDGSAVVAETAPFTWADGDIINIQGSYRAA